MKFIIPKVKDNEDVRWMCHIDEFESVLDRTDVSIWELLDDMRGFLCRLERE